MSKKKVKLTEEEKEQLILHYGTTDRDKINEISYALYKEKRQQRITYYLKNYINENDTRDVYVKAIYRIVNWPRLAGRERGQRRQFGMKTERTMTEKFIYRLDRGILTEQFEQKGYSKEASEQLVDRIYSIEDIWGNKSLKSEDYLVSDKDIFMKLEKVRYQRLAQENKENAEEMQ